MHGQMSYAMQSDKSSHFKSFYSISLSFDSDEHVLFKNTSKLWSYWRFSRDVNFSNKRGETLKSSWFLFKKSWTKLVRKSGMVNLSKYFDTVLTWSDLINRQKHSVLYVIYYLCWDLWKLVIPINKPFWRLHVFNSNYSSLWTFSKEFFGRLVNELPFKIKLTVSFGVPLWNSLRLWYSHEVSDYFCCWAGGYSRLDNLRAPLLETVKLSYIFSVRYSFWNKWIGFSCVHVPEILFRMTSCHLSVFSSIQCSCYIALNRKY